MVAILTGSSGNIGSSIKNYLVQKGYKVYCIYNNTKVLETSNIIPIKFDLNNIELIESLISKIYKKENRIDLLINCAAISKIAQIQDLSLEDYLKIINVNLNAPYILSKEVSKYMLKAHFGNIINISSIWGQIGASCEVAYSISKAGLDGLTLSLAKEMAASNIRVNTISPGFIDTKMNNSLTLEEKKQIKLEIPLQRFGKPEEIVSCIDFILNNEYLTAQIIKINGGWQ